MNRRSIIYGRVSSTSDRQNTDRQTYSLTKLIPEFLFYIRWADYIGKMQELHIQFCKPVIIPREKREMHAKGLYNFKLAMQKVEGKKIDIIANL